VNKRVAVVWGIFILCLHGRENVYTYDTGAGIDGWDVVEGVPAHQHLTDEALMVWKNAPQEFYNYATKSIYARLDLSGYANYDVGYDDLVTGSGDEDYVTTFLLPFGEYCSGDALNGFFEHFWNPDLTRTYVDNIALGGFNCATLGEGYNGGLPDVFSPNKTDNGRHFDSAYRLAQYLWDQKVIPLYHNGDKAQAYYWLGRVAHLLEDLAVPAHVHLLVHDPCIAGETCLPGSWGGEGDFYEPYGSGISINYKGDDPGLQGQEYKFECLPNLPCGFNWQDIHPNPTNLFRLFWYIAQKTQYFASKSKTGVLSAIGNAFYVRWDGAPKLFSPSLWEGEDVTIIGDPNEVEANLSQITDVLIPHTLRAVAGLYRLFWLETRPGTLLAKQAQLDIIHRAESDSRFSAILPETFGEWLEWDPSWELRWMNFNFSAGRVVTIWHATYKLDSAYRYTIFWDPDVNNWAPWVQAQ
jgi:hypothetical protein